MTHYTQPKQKAKSFTSDHPEGETGGFSPGVDCVHCGNPGFEHDKEKVHTKNGRYKYEYGCPE